MSVKVCLLIVVLKACLSQQVSPPKDYLQHKIPNYLEDCYSNPELRERALRLPSTINTLISLIQKAERNEHTEKYTKKVGGVLDATVMSYSILHRFRLDGIVREPDVPSSKANISGSGKGVIPYAPMGPEFNKYNILFGKLIPGNAILFPNSTLDPHEKCALHFMLSSTVDLWERGDESMTCKRPKVEDGNVPSRLSQCPLEDGVMAVHTPYSLRADTVSPGTVIAGIAASLQQQEIPLSKLLHNTEDGVTETDWIPVLHDVPVKPTILNTWAATLAGDVAEVAIYQGPYKLRTPLKDQEAIKADLRIGAEGWWGAGPDIPAPTVYTTDSRVAKWYYLLRNTDLEMTDAEIRGGIDGLLLGSAAARWIRTAKGRLRLSQILEMYYSDWGMAAFGEPELKWCNRLENFLQGSGAGGGRPVESNIDILRSQTMSFAQVLYENFHSVQFDYELLQEFVQLSVAQFHKYLVTDLDDQHCVNDYYGDDHKFKGYPKVDLTVVTDGTWSMYNLTKLTAYLAEECDVSLFGSRLSVMHGRTAQWLVKDAISSAQVVYNITKEAGNLKDVSSGLDVPLVIAKLGQNLAKKRTLERRAYSFKEIRAQVVLIMAHQSSIFNSDESKVQKDVAKFLSTYPDLHFYYVSLDNRGDPIMGIGTGRIIKAPNSHPEIVVSTVLETLRVVPRRIVISSCNGKVNQRKNVQPAGGSAIAGNLELEEYASPGETTFYRIHPSYLKDSKRAIIEFVGSGYGEARVCMTRYRPDEPRGMLREAVCRNMSTDVASFTLQDPCPGGTPYSGNCLPVYFSVNVTKSLQRCTEDDCRFPDQVRFSVWQQCNGASAVIRSAYTQLFICAAIVLSYISM